MSYKVVFFDIDGTLLNAEKRVPADTREAVKRLKQSGVETVIATGRAFSQFDFIAEELEIDSFVSCNGGYAQYKGHPVFERPIPKTTLESLTIFSGELGHPLAFAGQTQTFANYDQHPDVNESFHWLKLDTTPDCNPVFWKEEDIYQVYLYCKEREEEAYVRQFPDLTFLRAHRIYVDVFPKGVSKASGIEGMLKYLQLSPAEAVAFGDGFNDREMLSYVGMGIAMGNAHDEVKPYAKFTTKDVDHGGIVHGLQHIGLL